MLNEEQYTSLSKSDTYQLYVQIYNKLESKEKLIHQTVTKFTSVIEKTATPSNKSAAASVNSIIAETNDAETQTDPVRKSKLHFSSC